MRNVPFTDATRKALASAREAALELQHDYIGTEHLLLGLVGTWDNVARRAIDAVVPYARVQERLQEAVRRGTGVGKGLAEVPYTSRAKKTLEFAMKEARALGDGSVGPEHLLLGLIAEEKGIAASVLASVGVTREAVLRALAGERGEAVGRAPAVPAGEEPAEARRGGDDPARPVWFLEVDAASETPIYEQIIARVEEAVATGRLEPGERMPTVRQLAEELSLAPGTVARAYSELEKRGVLETAGARGTRVAPPRPRDATGSKRDLELEGLLRPVAVAAFHLGATAEQLRGALERAMKGILRSIAL